MKLREALIQQAPSLALQRAASDEIARMDALLDACRSALMYCDRDCDYELIDRIDAIANNHMESK
jgi:hypothetical protein